MSMTSSSSKSLAGAALLLVLAASAAAQGTDERPALAYGNTTAAAAATGSAARAKASAPAAAKKQTPAAAKEDVEVRYPAPAVNEVTVSDRDYNDFIFPSPVTQLVFPAGSPIVGEPVYLANNKQVLLQFRRGYDKAVQMIVETEDGTVYKLYVKPRPVNGVTHRLDATRQARAAAQQARPPSAGGSPEAATPAAADIELLKQVVSGGVPAGFEPIALPRPTRFDKFTVVPLAGWTDTVSRRVLVFSLVAVSGQTAVVAPPQFYRPGIAVAMVDGDVVDANNSPTLYVVEELQEEE